MAQLAAEHSPAWRGLAVSVLHVLVLDHLLPAAFGGKPECQYVHLLREVTEAAAGAAVPAGGAGAAGDDGARRADRRQPGKDAAEIDVFLSEVAQRAGVQLAQGELRAAAFSARLTQSEGAAHPAARLRTPAVTPLAFGPAAGR